MIKTIKNAFSPAIILALLAIPSAVVYALDHPLRLEHLGQGFSRMIEQSSPIDFGGMSAHLPALLGACLIVLAGFSVGVIARAAASGMTNKPGLKDGREPAPWSTAFTILAGWGFLILIIAAAGFVGWLNPAFLTLLLILSLLPLPWMVWTWVRGRAGDQVPSQRPWAIIAALSLLAAWVLLPAIVNVLSPPHEIDELIYHLVIVKTYLRHHYIVDLPYNGLSYNTRATHMLYLLAMGLFGDVSAKLVHFAFGMISAALVYNRAARFFGRRAGMMSAVIFLSHPVVIYLMGLAYVDLAITAFFLAAVEAYLDWRKTGSFTDFLRLALMMGFVGASKLTAAFFLAPFGLVLALDWIGAKDRAPLSRWLWFAGAFLIPLLPWTISSWARTGDPFYPYLTIGFDPGSAEAATIQPSLDGTFEIVGRGRTFSAYLLAPWNLLVHGKQLHPHFFGALHPALLALLAAGLPRLVRDPILRRLGFISLASLYLWTLGAQFLRYYLPGAALLTVLAGAGIAALIPGQSRTWPARTAGAIILILTLAASAIMPLYVWPRFMGALPYFTGARDRDRYLSEILPYFPMNQYINRETPADAVIFVWFEHGVYYLDRDVIMHHPEYYDRALYEIARTDSDREMLQWRRRNHVTHVMAHHPNLSYYRRMLGEDSPPMKDIEAAVARMKSFLGHYGKKIHWNAGLWLYEIEDQKK